MNKSCIFIIDQPLGINYLYEETIIFDSVDWMFHCSAVYCCVYSVGGKCFVLKAVLVMSIGSFFMWRHCWKLEVWKKSTVSVSREEDYGIL